MNKDSVLDSPELLGCRNKHEPNGDRCLLLLLLLSRFSRVRLCVTPQTSCPTLCDPTDCSPSGSYR